LFALYLLAERANRESNELATGPEQETREEEGKNGLAAAASDRIPTGILPKDTLFSQEKYSQSCAMANRRVAGDRREESGSRIKRLRERGSWDWSGGSDAIGRAEADKGDGPEGGEEKI
jgi:hypothetical protein